VSDIASDPVVRELRERIAANDLAILAAVNARLELVDELWRHKRDRGYARLDRNREAAMIELLARENGGPLSDQGVRDFYAQLVELTKREVADPDG
jgi:chorismate mutase